MNDSLTFKLLDRGQAEEIARLGVQLNPDIPQKTLESYLDDMFDLPTYRCFGAFIDNKLIGISSGWITIRFYSGKQLEVDNVVIDASLQSKGIGNQFLEYIEAWAIKNGCKTVELNSYVQNSRSHKFYYNRSYQVLGFHFLKWL